MATIENFLLKFKVDGQASIDRASRGIENLSNEVGQFGANTGPLNNALTGVLGRLGPIGLAAGAVGGAFAALGLQAVNLAAGISDIAGATGIAEGTLLNFRTSVIEAGGGADDFGQIAAKLNQNVQDAAGGNEKLQDSFRTLGVFVTDASGKIRSTESILRDITQQFQEGNLSGERYAAAVDLLGKNITRLDLTKLQAVADPIKDAEIKKLDEFSASIDRIRDSLERGIITFFGSVAQQAESAFNKIDQYNNKLAETEKQLNELGKTSRAFTPGNLMSADPGSGPGGTRFPRAMTQEERAVLALQQEQERMARLMAPYRPRPNERESTGGGFGAADPERLKREAEQRAKAAERAKEALERELQTINDMTAGYRRSTQANMDRYTMQVQLLGLSENEQELIRGTAEIERKYADQIAALEAKKATAKKETLSLIQESIDELEGLKTSEQDIFEITRRQTFEYKIQLDNVNRITDAITEQIARQSQLGDILRGINDQRIDVKFGADQQGRTPLQREIATIQENARKAALEAGRAYASAFEDSGDGLTAERAQELADGLSSIAQGYETIAEQQLLSLESSRTFSAGWKTAFDEYVENASNAALQAKEMFSSFTGNMGRALDNFVETGKFKFGDFARSVIQDILKIQLRAAASSFIGSLMGGTSIGSLFGFSNGGPTDLSPMIVGERGPELFIPNSAGRIIANNQLGGNRQQPVQNTYVTNNISAIDAKGVAQLFYENRMTLFGNVQMAQKELPTRMGMQG
jgi:lambda family phage tail tape measure protein